MTRIFYCPPAGSEPFMYEKGGIHIIQPPDQYWKRIKEPYVIGVVVDRATGKTQMNSKGEPVKVTGERKKFVLDKEKNDEVKAGRRNKPKNFKDIDDDTLLLLGRGEYNEWKPYLKRESDIEAEHRNSFDELYREHEQELAVIKKAQEAALRRERIALEEMNKRASAAENAGDPPAIMASSTSKHKNA